MIFHIKQGSTLPILQMKLSPSVSRSSFDDFQECIQSANITFSMWDQDCGRKIISCRPAKLVKKEVHECLNCGDEEFYIAHLWNEFDTLKCGTYIGEFTIEFDGNKGTLIAPVRDELIINVIPSKK